MTDNASIHVNCVEIMDKIVLSIIIILPHNTSASCGTQSSLGGISNILYCTCIRYFEFSIIGQVVISSEQSTECMKIFI